MGWSGQRERVLGFLNVHADRNEDGEFMVRNDDDVVSFLGKDEEYVIPYGVEVRVNGEWKPLVPMLFEGVRVAIS